MNYVQCRLRHIDGRRDMSWIPEKYAVKGKDIGIKNGGVWGEGWHVAETYGKRDAASVLAMSEHYRHHREGSDI